MSDGASEVEVVPVGASEVEEVSEGLSKFLKERGRLSIF